MPSLTQMPVQQGKPLPSLHSGAARQLTQPPRPAEANRKQGSPFRRAPPPAAAATDRRKKKGVAARVLSGGMKVVVIGLLLVACGGWCWNHQHKTALTKSLNKTVASLNSVHEVGGVGGCTRWLGGRAGGRVGAAAAVGELVAMPALRLLRLRDLVWLRCRRRHCRPPPRVGHATRCCLARPTCHRPPRCCPLVPNALLPGAAHLPPPTPLLSPCPQRSAAHPLPTRCAGEGRAAPPAEGDGESRAHQGSRTAAAAHAPGTSDFRARKDAQQCECSIASWLPATGECCGICPPGSCGNTGQVGRQATLQYTLCPSDAACLCPCCCCCSTSSTTASWSRTCSPARVTWLCRRAGAHLGRDSSNRQMRGEAASFL